MEKRVEPKLNNFLALFKKISMFSYLNYRFKNFWNYNDYLVGVRSFKTKSLMVIDLLRSFFSLLNLVQFLKNIFRWGAKMLFVDISPDNSEFYLNNLINKQFMHYIIKRPFNINGSLSNFSNTRWYYLKNDFFFFPRRKPDIFVLLDYNRYYNSIINEVFESNIPMVTHVDFTSPIFQKKILYRITMPLHAGRIDTKVFFVEVLRYLQKLTLMTKFLKQGLNNTTPNLNIYKYKTEAAEYFTQKKYIKIFFVRNVNKKKIKLSSFSNLWEKGFITINNSKSSNLLKPLWGKILLKKYKVKKHKIKLYNFNKLAKWKWYRRKKFKKLSYYIKKFIIGGKFTAPFNKIKRRNMMLKQLFCNIFDMQYNFKTWWRETIKKGFYTKLKYFNSRFKSATDFFYSMERLFILLVKKFFYSHTPRLVFRLIKNGEFFCNNTGIKSPLYKVPNNSIIQSKLFDTNTEELIDFFVFNLIDDFWLQRFFENKRDYHTEFMTYSPSDNSPGFPWIEPWEVLEKERRGEFSRWLTWHSKFWLRFVSYSALVEELFSNKKFSDEKYEKYKNRFDYINKRSKELNICL